MSDEFGLEQLSIARQAIAAAKTIPDAKKLLDSFSAMGEYAKRQKLELDIQNEIAECRIWTRRKIGAMLEVMPKAKGSAGTMRGRDSSGGPTLGPPENETPTLSDIGISKAESSRMQAESSLSPDVVQEYIDETKEQGKEVTTAGIHRLARKRKQEQESQSTVSNVLQIPEMETQYRVLVIDPPWPVKKILRDERPNQDVLDYRTMSIEEIARLPVGELANLEGCHVYLWTTHKFLPDALQLFVHWNVKYQCILTWCKNVGFTPFSWMYDTEHVLFGRIGSLGLLRNGLRLSFEAKVTKHSEKPDIFYERVIQVSPEPRLELFARRKREGFDVWGDEI